MNKQQITVVPLEPGKCKLIAYVNKEKTDEKVVTINKNGKFCINSEK